MSRMGFKLVPSALMSDAACEMNHTEWCSTEKLQNIDIISCPGRAPHINTNLPTGGPLSLGVE